MTKSYPASAETFTLKTNTDRGENMSKQNGGKDGWKSRFCLFPHLGVLQSPALGWKKSQEQEKQERKERPFQTRAEEQAEWVVRTAASVSTSAEDLPARRGIVSQMPPPYLPWVRLLSRPGTSGSLTTFVCNSRVCLLCLMLTASSCPGLPLSTIQALGPTKSSGTRSSLAHPVPWPPPSGPSHAGRCPHPRNLTGQVSGSVSNVTRLLQPQFRKDRKSQWQ